MSGEVTLSQGRGVKRRLDGRGIARYPLRVHRPLPTVLLLAWDRQLRVLLLEIIGSRRRVTVCDTPAEARERLRTEHYALVLVTNFGVGPFQAVEIIPADRDYTVLFLTGYLDARLDEECRRRNIVPLLAPFKPAELQRELRIALEDVT